MVTQAAMYKEWNKKWTIKLCNIDKEIVERIMEFYLKLAVGMKLWNDSTYKS